MSPKLSRNIWLLSLVSLFTDMASEMLYPVMPVYLRSIGFSVLLIGFLEGIAEAVAGLSKSYFGGLSDRSGRRLPFVQWGYALSALSKPMMALLTQAWWIFLARTTDRLGKGIRTGARDALLSREAGPGQKATVFGFHRAMDTLGAVFRTTDRAGISLFLSRTVSMAFPAGISARCHGYFPDPTGKGRPTRAGEAKGCFAAARVSLLEAKPGHYRALVSGLLVFALVNSSDLLLLLKIRESGYSDQQVIGLYIFYNLIYALMAYPAGRLADRLGMRNVFVAGLALFGLTYTGFAFQDNVYGYLFLFTCYGAYAAATEGVAKAWISRLVDPTETATAIGTYTGFQSIAALLASSLAGAAWYAFGPAWAFGASGAVAVMLIFYFLRLPAKTPTLKD